MDQDTSGKILLWGLGAKSVGGGAALATRRLGQSTLEPCAAREKVKLYKKNIENI